MNFVKNLFLVAVLFGAQAQGMNNKPVVKVLPKEVTDIAKIMQYLVDNREAGYAIAGRALLPKFVFDSFEKFLGSDLTLANSLKTHVVGKNLKDNQEYQSLKFDVSLAFAIPILKPLIIKAGVTEKLYKKAFLMWGISALFGKLGACVYNRSNADVVVEVKDNEGKSIGKTRPTVLSSSTVRNFMAGGFVSYLVVKGTLASIANVVK